MKNILNVTSQKGLHALLNATNGGRKSANNAEREGENMDKKDLEKALEELNQSLSDKEAQIIASVVIAAIVATAHFRKLTAQQEESKPKN